MVSRVVQVPFMKRGLPSWILKDETFSRIRIGYPGRGLGSASSTLSRRARVAREWGVSPRWLQLGVSREGVVMTGGPKAGARLALFAAHTTSQHKSIPLGSP